MNFTNSTFNATLSTDNSGEFVLFSLLMIALIFIGLILAADELRKNGEEYYSRLPEVHLMKTIKSDA